MEFSVHWLIPPSPTYRKSQKIVVKLLVLDVAKLVINLAKPSLNQPSQQPDQC